MNLALEVGGLIVGVGALLLTWGTVRMRKRIPLVLQALTTVDWPIPGRAISDKAQIPLHAIYPLLAHMEDLGLVTSREESGGPERGGLPGRFYAITHAGRARLAEERESP